MGSRAEFREKLVLDGHHASAIDFTMRKVDAAHEAGLFVWTDELRDLVDAHDAILAAYRVGGQTPGKAIDTWVAFKERFCRRGGDAVPGS